MRMTAKQDPKTKMWKAHIMKGQQEILCAQGQSRPQAERLAIRVLGDYQREIEKLRQAFRSKRAPSPR